MYKLCVSKTTVSSTFSVISACSSLSTSLRKSISGSEIDDGFDALFLLFLVNCGVKVNFRIYVIFVFL